MDNINPITGLPINLYHYTTAGPTILTTKRLRSTAPVEFNDPFEFTCDFAELDPKDPNVAEEYLKALYMIRADRDENAEKLGKEDLEIMLRAVEKFPEPHRTNFLNMPTRVNEQLAGRMANHVGVTCFCEQPLNLLLWSHYADQHRGMAIGFKFDSELFGNRPMRVEYQDKRPTVRLVGDTTEFQILASTKSKNWEYEKEWRILRGDHEYETIVSNGSLIRLFDIKTEFISEIYFGCRFPEGLKQAMLVYLSREEFHDVVVYETRTHESDYALTRHMLEH